MESAKSADSFSVEVAYALPERQSIIALVVEPGTTLEQAVVASGILAQYPEIDLATAKTGIFGRLAKRDQPLRAGDRVEIYRPLIADPKEVRRQRAAQGKAMKTGGGGSEEAGEAV